MRTLRPTRLTDLPEVTTFFFLMFYFERGCMLTHAHVPVGEGQREGKGIPSRLHTAQSPMQGAISETLRS